ncbi:hypothetical protein AB9H29_05715 [Stenotrophomonas sepilia]|uniref:hypothetical protein n=1 Tax=Stenotrophomonas sepilia TaxID=2860290 RepID=UPI003556CB65
MINKWLGDLDAREFIGRVELLDVDVIWWNSFDYLPGLSFEDRKQFFRWGLGAVLREGRARLEDVNGFWGGTVNEQIERFMAAWPPESDWDPDMFWVAKPGYGWVPSGFVWKLEDGSYFSP